MLATEEVLSLLKAKDHKPISWIVYVGNMLIPLAASLPIVLQLLRRPSEEIAYVASSDWPLAVLAVMTMVVFIGEMARYERPGHVIVNAGLSIMTMVYVGLCISFWSLLRLHGTSDWGLIALFSLLLIVKM